MPLKMRVHDREHIGAALRRFKKLLERSGITKEFEWTRRISITCNHPRH
jgi:ribosomal protein S21